jgi:DNA polymerase III delta prime subunit
MPKLKRTAPAPFTITTTTGVPASTSAQKVEDPKTALPPHPLNLIFYGPPGTGKTYAAVERALALLGLRQENPVVNQHIFHQLLGDRVEFITFHENYTYEDFVQGLKPDISRQAGTLIYTLRDGVFKRIADRALMNYRRATDLQFLKREKAFVYGLQKLLGPLERDEKDEITLQANNNQTFYLTGFSPGVIKVRYGKISMESDIIVSVLQQMFISHRRLHELYAGVEPNPYYDTILAHLLEYEREIPETEMPDTEIMPYVIIIDEINGAPLSKVFGELITLIEDDKRYGMPHALSAILPISGTEFVVPPNLYLIGTMNLTEKNRFAIDVAMRRRFEFEYLPPRVELIPEKWRDLFKRMNEALVLLKGPDYQLGHSFFMNDSMPLTYILNNKVIPLLYEYFERDHDQVHKMLDFAGIRHELFHGKWMIT